MSDDGRHQDLRPGNLQLQCDVGSSKTAEPQFAILLIVVTILCSLAVHSFNAFFIP